MGKTARSPVRLAVTCGDPFGIGPEVCAAATRGLEGAEITLFGDPEHLGAVADSVQVREIPGAGQAPDPPGPTEAGGRASLAALDAALAEVRTGRQDALVTGPVSKEACTLTGIDFTGQTGYVADALNAPDPLMAFVWDPAEPVVALLTTHIPLRAVPASLTSGRVEAAVEILHGALVERFGRARAHIGVLGLNPHAGEGGLLGTEELDVLEGALTRLRKRGRNVTGPLPGDTAFAFREGYDALLALYHDQGLAPVKALAFHRAVNLTLGLPVIRTSPAHGTAFDRAGRGNANPSSMRAALEWAVRLSR